jgi:hypothetical protein
MPSTPVALVLAIVLVVAIVLVCRAAIRAMRRYVRNLWPH